MSFRKALGCFASGVTVVTAMDAAGSPVGLTVSAFSSVSLVPPLVLICLDRRVSALDAFERGPFAVNILAEGQRELSNRFATRRDDRFAAVEHAPGHNGAPLIGGVVAAIECDTHEVIKGGDHSIILGAVTRVDVTSEDRPLLYFRGAYAGLA
ncbi:flavin reductase family protein [Roseospira marina]|uniref:flavin reductase family protein n=1 Tax=Roseospira marina TaxID=140057 RepID=UPI00288977A3|nr:flavin reductase family protein [Roseospira marina]